MKKKTTRILGGVLAAVMVATSVSTVFAEDMDVEIKESVVKDALMSVYDSNEDGVLTIEELRSNTVQRDWICIEDMSGRNTLDISELELIHNPDKVSKLMIVTNAKHIVGAEVLDGFTDLTEFQIKGGTSDDELTTIDSVTFATTLNKSSVQTGTLYNRGLRFENVDLSDVDYFNIHSSFYEFVVDNCNLQQWAVNDEPKGMICSLDISNNPIGDNIALKEVMMGDIKAQNCGITDLYFLDDYETDTIGLHSLDLSYNDISDISYLGLYPDKYADNPGSGLMGKPFTSIDLSHNEITDMSPLRLFHHMFYNSVVHTFDLSDNPITEFVDITATDNKEGGVRLYLANTQIDNLDALMDDDVCMYDFIDISHTSITEIPDELWDRVLGIKVGGSNFKQTEIEIPETISEDFHSFELASCKVTDVAGFENTPNLKQLSICGTNVSDLSKSGLESCTLLEEMVFDCNTNLQKIFSTDVNYTNRQLKKVVITNCGDKLTLPDISRTDVETIDISHTRLDSETPLQMIMDNVPIGTISTAKAVNCNLTGDFTKFLEAAGIAGVDCLDLSLNPIDAITLKEDMPVKLNVESSIPMSITIDDGYVTHYFKANNVKELKSINESYMFVNAYELDETVTIDDADIEIGCISFGSNPQITKTDAKAYIHGDILTNTNWWEYQGFLDTIDTPVNPTVTPPMTESSEEPSKVPEVAPTVSPSVSVKKVYDVDGNVGITLADAQLVLKFALKIEASSQSYTLADAQMVLKRALKIIDMLPGETEAVPTIAPSDTGQSSAKPVNSSKPSTTPQDNNDYTTYKNEPAGLYSVKSEFAYSWNELVEEGMMVEKMNGYWTFDHNVEYSSQAVLVLPDGAKVLDFYNPNDSINIEAVILPESVKRLEYKCFDGVSLKYINTDNVEYVGDYALFNHSVDGYTFNAATLYLGEAAIGGTKLEYLKLPNDTTFYEDANQFPKFLYGGSVKELQCNDYLSYICSIATDEDETETADGYFTCVNDVITGFTAEGMKHFYNETVITIPDGVKGIQNLKLTNVENVSEIVLPESCEYIGDNALAGGSFTCVLEKINLEHVKYIGDSALEHHNLKEVDLSNAEFVGEYAFDWNVTLETVKGAEGSDWWNSRTIFRNTKWQSELSEIVVNKGVLIQVNDDTIISFTVPEVVTKLGTGCFADNVNLESVVLHKGITEIPAHCFANCENLKDVNIESIKTIQNNAFENAGNEMVIDLSQVVYIGDNVFLEAGIDTVTLPVDYMAMLDSTGLFTDSNLKIVSGETFYIPEYCFDSCNDIKELSLPNVIWIKKYAFFGLGDFDNEYIKGLSDLIENANVIDASAFASAKCIDTITINAEKVGKYAFEDTSVKQVTWNSNSMIEEHVFEECDELNLLIINKPIKILYDNAFSDKAVIDLVLNAECEFGYLDDGRRLNEMFSTITGDYASSVK